MFADEVDLRPVRTILKYRHPTFIPSSCNILRNFPLQQEGIWMTPVAVVEKKNREVLRLYGPGVCR